MNKRLKKREEEGDISLQMPLRRNRARLCSRGTQQPRLAESPNMPCQPWCDRLPEQALSCGMLSLT